MLQWIKKIKCIDRLDKNINELYFYIAIDKILNKDFDNLIGLLRLFNEDSLFSKGDFNMINDQDSINI